MSQALSDPTPDALSAADARKLVAAIQLPPQPEIVRELMRERASEDPDMGRLARLIGQDMGMAAAVLKTVNSPFYGLRRKLNSIPEALVMLGLKNLGALVMALALRAGVSLPGMERFWESSNRAAQLAHMLARHLGLGNADEAHLYMLFHDSAMPVMLQRLPGYAQTIEHIARLSWTEITGVEDARHNTNHAVVGGLLVQNWGLPNTIRDAISLHHDASAFASDGVSHEVKTLIALGHVAERVEETLSRRLNDCAWDAFGAASQRHLMMGEEEMQDFMDRAQDHFAAS